MHWQGETSRKSNIENSMKTNLPISLAAAALFFGACEARVNTAPGPAEKETNTIVTPGGGGGTKTENNTTVVNPPASKPSKTETNTNTTVSPGGVQQNTTTETK
jgi:hypothetical protein